jgi:DNA replication protein DnaC
LDNERSVKRCECFFRSQADKLLELCGIPARHSRCDFSTYKTDSNSALQFAKGAVEKWAKEYPLDKTGLLLVGSSGVGKTHLSVSALKMIAQKGVNCLFCDYRELLKKIQNSYNSSVQSTELEVLRPVFEAEVLVLDDLGAVKPSEWVWDTVSLILNTRYNHNRTTIITSNFELDEDDLDDHSSEGYGALARVQAAARSETLRDRIGKRMISRLFEMCRIITVPGKDYRVHLHNTNFR